MALHHRPGSSPGKAGSERHGVHGDLCRPAGAAMTDADLHALQRLRGQCPRSRQQAPGQTAGRDHSDFARADRTRVRLGVPSCSAEWKGYEEALGRYGLTMCEVWTERGFGDTCAGTIIQDLRTFGIDSIRDVGELAAAGALPGWLFDPELLRSHQSALVRKDPEHYRQRFPDVPDDLDYVWPVRSAVVIERELRKQENARRREQRRLERLAIEAAKVRRRRSLAAKRGWKTRKGQQVAGEFHTGG